MVFSSLYITWTVFKKDLAVWWNNKQTIVSSILPVISLLLLQALGAVAVGRTPVALVVQDQAMVGKSLQQIFQKTDAFQITQATSAQAQDLLNRVQVVAVITIPADATRRFSAHETFHVQVTINNLEADFTDDLYRAVADAQNQFYQQEGQTNAIQITPQEHDIHTQEVGLFQANIIPALVLLLMVSSLVTNSISVAREWESSTVKELLLAPVARSAIIMGKILCGVVTTLLLGLLTFGLTSLLGWTHPMGEYWGISIGIIALIALFGTGLGVTLGILLKSTRAAGILSVLLSFYLFFLSGGIGVLAFEPGWLQQIATFCPLTYGVHALQQVVLYGSSNLLGRDVLVLSISFLVTLGLGSLAIRRGIAG